MKAHTMLLTMNARAGRSLADAEKFCEVLTIIRQKYQLVHGGAHFET